MAAPRIYGNKNYGDQKAIDSLVRQASGMKQSASDAAPTIRTREGRPTGPTNYGVSSPHQPGATVQPAPQDIPVEHVTIMEEAASAVALAQRTARFLNDPTAGPWLRWYAERAREEAAAKLRAVRENTPNFRME